MTERLRALDDDGLGRALAVAERTGILFIPGWLRMLDLWLHTRRSRLTGVVAPAVRLFAWLYRRVPAVRRHGYLTVCVAVRAD